MSDETAEFYKLTMGPEVAGLIDHAIAKERSRITQLIEGMKPGDCCWQYHSGHLAKSDIIKVIEAAA